MEPSSILVSLLIVTPSYVLFPGRVNMELEYLTGSEFMVEMVVEDSVTALAVGSGSREIKFWKE